MTTGRYIELLKHSGFQAFLWTQFLGAFNDHVYKIAISLLAVSAAAGFAAGSGHLSLVGAIYILPFLLFSGYAGYLADVYSKRDILVAMKIFEILAMALGFFALLSGRFGFMLAVLFLMALHSTFFSPAKYGILPEMLPDKDLSRANGLLEMSTFVAIILGTSAGSAMLFLWKARPERVGILLTAIAVAGTLASLRIPRVPPSGARKAWTANPLAEIAGGMRRLYSDENLWLIVVGISYFWFLGALLQMDIILLGKELMGLDDFRIGLLATFLAIGIGIGSIAAGRLSGDKVELGLVPIGSIGVGIFSLLLSSSSYSYHWTATALAFLGFSGGLFIVPLNAFLQQRSGREEKGQLIATNNFLNTVGILLASGILWTFRDLAGLRPDLIIMVFGLFTLIATACILAILPAFLIRFSLWMLTHTIYKIRIAGQEHVPFRGPALLVCNHLSQVDALLVGACVQRFIRFMMHRDYYEIKLLNWLFRMMKVIPVSGRNRSDILHAIERARSELREGHVVCIFAEGAVSRTGNLLPFKRGFEKIAAGLNVPIIPVYLDRLWGSIFSFKHGRFFWKWPEQIPYPVTVAFGAPLPPAATASQARQAIMELGSEAIRFRRPSTDLLHLRFVRTARQRWFSFCMADSTGRELTYGKALTASFALSRWIRRQCGADSKIGILLPASVAGALANIAVRLAGKTPVNLNFTAGREAMGSAIEQCEIRKILTSRAFLERAKTGDLDGMTFLEDVMKDLTFPERLLSFAKALLLPPRLIQRLHHGGKPNPDDLATVVFSSGSTGVPKGVMLSHHNILSNIESMAQLFWVNRKDRIMGVLPFFHSLGFTATLWLPLVAGVGVVYHSNPKDAKTIGEMVARHRCTILISTPTFCGLYSQACTSEQFASLRYAMVGAEKLRESVATSFAKKFGLELLEGYGCTEMAPVVSANVPDIEEGREHQKGHKPGTAGHPIPGVAVKVVDPETSEPLAYDQEGLLLVKGPNRMLGYLGQPEKTAEVLREGWYVTGDIASIDEDGFIRITDRLSRFSKIGGEMVPHIKLEEAINQILGDQACVVTSIPDEQKGECLVAFYTCKDITAEELWEKLARTDLPKLWIPRRENIHLIDAIPVLETGKVDLKKVKAIAQGAVRIGS